METRDLQEDEGDGAWISVPVAPSDKGRQRKRKEVSVMEVCSKCQILGKSREGTF
jgi:hypothetical protein